MHRCGYVAFLYPLLLPAPYNQNLLGNGNAILQSCLLALPQAAFYESCLTVRLHQQLAHYCIKGVMTWAEVTYFTCL